MGRLAGFELHDDALPPARRHAGRDRRRDGRADSRRWRRSSSRRRGRPSCGWDRTAGNRERGTADTRVTLLQHLKRIHAHRRPEGDQDQREPDRPRARPAPRRSPPPGTRCWSSRAPDSAAASPTPPTRPSGATILPTADEVWQRAEMIMKVKEPIAVGVAADAEGAGDLHLLPLCRRGRSHPGGHRVRARSRWPTRRCSSRAASCRCSRRCPRWRGGWRCRRAPSTWRRSSAAAASCSAACRAWRPGEVVIIGGGVVGINAAKMAAGLGAHVTILDISLDRLRYLDDVLPANVDTAYSNRHNILDAIRRADLVIGAVLLPGAKAPHLVKRADLKTDEAGLGHRGRRGRPGRAASRRSSRRRTKTPPTSSTAFCTTPSQICPAACPARRPSRSPMPRCRTHLSSPARAGVRRARPIRRCASGSTWSRGRSSIRGCRGLPAPAGPTSPRSSDRLVR